MSQEIGAQTDTVNRWRDDGRERKKAKKITMIVFFACILEDMIR